MCIHGKDIAQQVYSSLVGDENEDLEAAQPKQVCNTFQALNALFS